MTEREFHEVQLSGKQLVFLFISAVVLAVVIFLLGVAVGRGVRGTVDDVPVSASNDTEAVVQDDPTPQAAPELSYHDLLAGASGTPATPETTPPTTEAPPPAPPAPVAEPTSPPPAPAEPATGGWFLQVGAYSGRQAADGQVAALKKLGAPAFVLVPAAGAPDGLFRVRVGPYGTEAEANQARVGLVREGFTPQVVR
jgi:cell division protein FtsN